jgi:hypothetical protein
MLVRRRLSTGGQTPFAATPCARRDLGRIDLQWIRRRCVRIIPAAEFVNVGGGLQIQTKSHENAPLEKLIWAEILVTAPRVLHHNGDFTAAIAQPQPAREA